MACIFKHQSPFTSKERYFNVSFTEETSCFKQEKALSLHSCLVDHMKPGKSSDPSRHVHEILQNFENWQIEIRVKTYLKTVGGFNLS